MWQPSYLAFDVYFLECSFPCQLEQVASLLAGKPDTSVFLFEKISSLLCAEKLCAVLVRLEPQLLGEEPDI